MEESLKYCCLETIDNEYIVFGNPLNKYLWNLDRDLLEEDWLFIEVDEKIVNYIYNEELKKRIYLYSNSFIESNKNKENILSEEFHKTVKGTYLIAGEPISKESLNELEKLIKKEQEAILISKELANYIAQKQINQKLKLNFTKLEIF